MIKSQAMKHCRWGYRLLLGLLRCRGLQINHKKFLKIYRQENLQIGKRTRAKKLRVERIKSEMPEKINQRWSMDFMYDILENKRSYRVFNVIDDYNRECLVCKAGRRFGGYDVSNMLDEAIKKYGKPEVIKSDNGSEFRSHHMRKWSEERGIKLEYIEAGKPTQNAQIESFNGTLREEELRINEYENLKEVQKRLDKWREIYNKERPHSSLGYAPPASRRRSLESVFDKRLEKSNKNKTITINEKITQTYQIPLSIL